LIINVKPNTIIMKEGSRGQILTNDKIL